MSENQETQKGLSHYAYGGIEGDKYEPYISDSENMPEFTMRTLIIGAVMSLLFAATNTYLGLTIANTISASVPGAVLGAAALRMTGKYNILENVIIQASASAGQSATTGIIYVMPALIIWGFNDEFTSMRIFLVIILGTILGTLAAVPLRQSLIVDEHGKLPYPEGLAASEVLVACDVGGASAGTMLKGGAVAALFRFLSDGLKLFSADVSWPVSLVKNGQIGLGIAASMTGVGYIVGLRIGLYMLGGAIMANFLLIPIISYFGASVHEAVFPGKIPIADMNADQIWGAYVRYIGAGAVAAGGFISLAQNLPMMIKSFRQAIGGIGGSSAGTKKRTDKDVSMIAVGAGVLGVFVAGLVLPDMNLTWVGSLSVIVFGLFFAAVSAQITGIVGKTNLPVSAMTIAALLVSTIMLKFAGVVGKTGMITALLAGGVICFTITAAGNASQNFKISFLTGSTPKKIQITLIVMNIVAALVIGSVIMMLHQAYGLGSKAVPAPQATLMSMVVKGVMDGDLPWDLVLSGASVGVILAVLRLPILPVAIGLYLPMNLSAGMLVGGIIRWFVDNKFKNNESLYKEKTEKGILLASGFIAGDTIFGILIAGLAAFKINIGIFGDSVLANNAWWGLMWLLILCVIQYRWITGGKTNN